MQRYCLWAKILTLGVAGVAAYLLFGAWVCECELITKEFDPAVNPALVAKLFRYGAEASAALALLLLAGVSLAEGLFSVPLARVATQPRESGSLDASLWGTEA